MSSLFLQRICSYTTACIMLFMMLHSGKAYGQNNAGKSVVLRITDTVLKVNNKELKDITVQLTNNGTDAFSGYLSIACGKGAKVATKDSVHVVIAAGQQIFVPSKVYINQSAQEGIIPVVFGLKNSAGVIVDSSNIRLVLAPSRLLTVTLEDADMVLPKIGDPINIPIRISNHGNVSQGGVVVVAFPSALKDKSNKSIKFFLESFKDTVIIFQRKATRDMARLGYMTITINGLYDDGNIFGSYVVSVQNLTSKRSFEESLGEVNLMRNNVLTMGVQNAFDYGETYYIRSRGDYKITDGRVAYNFNLTRWKDGNLGTAISGTTLDVAYKRVGAHLGNITQNGDLSYTGRGGEVYLYLDSSQSKKVFAGYLDKSINLIATDNSNTSFGNASWLGYRYEKQKMLNITTFSYDEDKINQVRSELLVDNLTWKVSNHLSTDMKAGVANSTSTIGNDQSHPSFAAGLNYFGNFFDKLSLTGNNSYATGYYPGSRRGTLYLNEGAFFKMGKSTLSSTVIYSNSAPKYFNQTNLFSNSNDENTSLEMSYTKNLGPASISLIPNYYTENGNWFFNSASQYGTMSSLRFSTLLTYNPVRSQQTLYFRTDIGGYRTSFSDSNKLQFKSSLTYSISNFRIVSTIQKGDFYLAEVFQEHFTGYNSFRFNFGPSFTKFFFNRSLKWDAGVAYNKDFYSNSFLLTSNIAYGLGPMALFSNVQYNIYSNTHSYKNIQFGLSYFLPESHAGQKIEKGRIEVFTYYDLNRNGTFDKGDSIASGIIVRIGKTILMSGHDGKVIYNKLPAGNYSVYLPTQNGWYGRDQFVNLKEKETRTFSIPLSQTGVVHGSINYQFDSTFSFSVNRDKAWQSIVATNQDGLRFEAKTDEGGNFNLYLPVGVYTIIVDNLPNQVELVLTGNNVQPLKVESGEIINNVDFILKVKQRSVQIKKFGKQQ